VIAETQETVVVLKATAAAALRVVASTSATPITPTFSGSTATIALSGDSSKAPSTTALHHTSASTAVMTMNCVRNDKSSV
jgi:hypothetical protein